MIGQPTMARALEFIHIKEGDEELQEAIEKLMEENPHKDKTEVEYQAISKLFESWMESYTWENHELMLMNAYIADFVANC